MSWRVIALDLDGTLLTPQKTLLPQTLAALKQARKAGIKVIIVTGRHHSAIHPFYQALELDTPIICCNGAYLYDYQQQKVLASSPLTTGQALAILDLLELRQLNALMYADDAMYYQETTAHVLRTQNWANSLTVALRPVFQQVSSLREAALTARNIWKFALTDENIAHLQASSEMLQEQLDLTCEWSWHDQIDVTKLGNNKGKCLAAWVEAQGFTMDQVIAFGDNDNDLSMLERAGLGVAMGNAHENVKARADLVIGTNVEPSIADTLYERVL